MIHYIAVRRDLPFGTTLAMVAHAAAESNDLVGHCTVCVLGVRNERTLLKLHAKLNSYGIKNELVCEPDEPWNGAAMSLGVRPGSRDDLSPYFTKFQTYQVFQEPVDAAEDEKFQDNSGV